MSNEDEASKKNKELEDAAACGKLWDVYAKEAQEYDDRLVKSWKEDMDSILVFSGLYSAILTAFIIESYQKLQPDPADNSAVLLKRISQQLATPLNSTGLTPFPDDEAFSPTSSALACNILWFISLALALASAFLATLVQQWSRRFLQRTSSARSPGVHAHLLQYLYFGLKDLKMHVIVDSIPSLLHLSLFSFFAGLVGFLKDVNKILTWLFAIVLVIAQLIYLTFTVLPLVYLDSPYSTPISEVLWRIVKLIKIILDSSRVRAIWSWSLRMKRGNEGNNENEVGTGAPNDEEAQPLSARETEKDTPTDAQNIQRGSLSLIDASLRESKVRRSEHESRCITWTLNSLNDDTELLPFLEALPHVLLGDDLDCLREQNFHLMNALVSETDIVSRTLSLMENATNSWHEDKHRTRCAIAGAKTLYSLARVLVDQRFRSRFTYPCSSPFTGELARISREELFRTDESKPFYNSVLVLCILSVLQSLNDCIQPDQSIPHIPFQEANRLLKSHYPSWMMKTRRNPENEPPGARPEQAKSAINEMISTAFYGYLLHTRYRPSFNLVHVSEQMVQDGSDFLQAEEDPGDLFYYLTRSYYSQTPNENADIERMNTVFHIGFDGFISFTLAKGSEDDQNETLKQMSNYIATRFDVGGWGSTKEIWSRSERLLKLLGCLGQSEASLNCVSDSALQELLLHAVDEDSNVVISFLEHRLSHIHAQEEHMPKSHIWFLLVLIILYKFYYNDDKERFSSILDQINGELPVDPESNDTSPCPHIKDEAYPEVKVILYCLDSKLPAENIRDILQLLFYCLRPWSWEDLWSQPNVRNELVKHSEHFATQFLQTPSKGLMDITALVWSLLWYILPKSAPGIDDAREAWEAIRSGLKSLSGSADKLLSPDGRKTVDEEIKKSTPGQNRTILEDGAETCLNLLDVVKIVQECLPMILEEIDRVHPPTTTSPSSSDTVIKETELVTHDHNTSQATESPQLPEVMVTPAAPSKAEVGVQYEPLLAGDDDSCG